MYEMGAGVIARSCTVVWDLAKKFDIDMSRVKFIKPLFIDIDTGRPIDGKTPFSAI